MLTSTFTVNRAQLAKALTGMHGVVPSKKQTTLQVLRTVMLIAGDKDLTVNASNLELYRRVSLPLEARSGQNAGACVPYYELKRFVSGLTGETVTIKISDTQTMCEISGALIADADDAVLLVESTPTTEFPEFGKDGEPYAPLLDHKDLAEAVTFCKPAVSTDTHRAILTGMFMAFDLIQGEGIKLSTVAAADGFRLAVWQNSAELPEFLRVIVPGNSAAIIARDIGAEAEIAVTKNDMLLIRTGNVAIKTMLIAGKFPDYTQIIPKETNISVIVDPRQMLKAARLAVQIDRQVSGDLSNIIFAHGTGPGRLILGSVAAPNYKDKRLRRIPVPCNYTQNDVDEPIEELGVNGSYLTTALLRFSKVSLQSFTFSVTTRSNPMVLAGTHSESPCRTYRYVIMPMHNTKASPTDTYSEFANALKSSGLGL